MRDNEEDGEEEEEEDEDEENSEEERLTLQKRTLKKPKVEVTLLEPEELEILCDDIDLVGRVTNKISKFTSFLMACRWKLYKDDVLLLCPCGKSSKH